MSETRVRPEQPMMLHLLLDLGDDQLLEFCSINREWRIERTAEGELEIMPPTGGYTSGRNADLIFQSMTWTRQNGTGVAFESNGGFILPNGAMRSPDASWVSRDRLSNLTAEQKQKFLPLCQDFVIELRSPSDPLATVEAEMREYLENGTRLGWLVDLEARKVHVYRPNEEPKLLDKPESLTGESILPGFILNLNSIWEPGF